MEENQAHIPDGWKSYIGNEILKVQGGYAFKSNDYKDEGILLVRIGNVGNGNFVFKDVICVPKRFQLTHPNFQLWKGDVLMGLTGDLGKICILKNGEFPYFLNQRVGKFISTDKIDNEYLYYLVSSSLIQSKFDAFFAGGAQKNISPKQIESITYLIPENKTEQTQIATILSKVDDAITKTEQLIAKYTRIKTGLMQDLLTKGIDKNGNIRSEETHEFKDSPLGRIPKEWEVTYVDCLCNEIIVGIVIRPTQYYIESGIPMLRSQNIKEEGVVMKDLVYMSEFDNHKLSKSKLSENDVVSVRTGYPGTSSVITKGIEGCNCIDLVISRPNQLLLNSHFLALFINSELGRKQILNHQSGVAQQHFNVGQMKELIIVKLTINEQLRILNQINCLNNQLTNFNTNLSKLQSLKTGLMQDLLSGKVRVNHLIKETASV